MTGSGGKKLSVVKIKSKAAENYNHKEQDANVEPDFTLVAAWSRTHKMWQQFLFIDVRLFKMSQLKCKLKNMLFNYL